MHRHGMPPRCPCRTIKYRRRFRPRLEVSDASLIAWSLVHGYTSLCIETGWKTRTRGIAGRNSSRIRSRHSSCRVNERPLLGVGYERLNVRCWVWLCSTLPTCHGQYLSCFPGLHCLEQLSIPQDTLNLGDVIDDKLGQTAVVRCEPELPISLLA